MKRAGAVAALFVALMPATALAQIVGPVPAGQLTIAPFVGIRVGHSVEFTDQVGAPGASTAVTERLEVDGGPTVGAALHVPIGGRVLVVGSGTWAFSEEGSLEVSGSGGSAAGDSDDTGSIFFARAGLGYQFVDTEPESRIRSVAAVLSAGPVAARLDPGDAAGDSEWHWGLAIGADAIVPLGDSPLHLYIGADDYLMFWDGERLPARRAAPGAVTERNADSSNILTLRAGVGLRF